MNRTDREMSQSYAYELLKQHQVGVLSILLPNQTPYGVPMNYGLYQQTIIMHGAPHGLKYESLLMNPQASFTVIGNQTLLLEELSTAYSSVIAFGRVEILKDYKQKIEALKQMLDHYPLEEHIKHHALEGSLEEVAVFVFHIDSLTAKAHPSAH
ncbi:MAG: pyridoxamine 5'-phosphate oxidase family protein [Candidatus Izemoplasmatales bacterium]|nr:pyridoxamine 5'-phosphate oxidase family protein [bacterium]MDZ4196388.1 pyridoxamine 5'-phosphate oxidase family protein [Candidatus Izemoplasmatales bacterium]